ncbi:MAG TPA: S9 family peptidase [Rhizomicrobium sp.]|nr:S9 family peptidase [Rhizomicrobium sp.]
MKAALFALAIAAGVAAAQDGQARVLQPGDLFQLSDVSDPQMSPDGGWVLYAVRRYDEKADRSRSHIWMAKTDGSRALQLTNRETESESDPRFSPDGRWISFISGRGDDKKNDQIWLMDRAGGEAKKLTALTGELEDYAWAPDGRRLVLVVQDEDKNAVEDGKTPKPIVIDRFRFMQDVVGYLTTLHDHLYLLDVASRKLEQLTSGRYSEGFPSWSPDGRTIAFVCKCHPNADRDNNWGLYTIAARTGAAPRQIADQIAAGSDAERPDGNEVPAWSPDGKTLAIVQYGDPKWIEYGVDHLSTVSAAGGPVRPLTAALDRNVGAPHWSADGKSILMVVEDDRTEYLAQIPAAGGSLTRLAGARDDITGYSIANGHVAFLLSTPTMPPEVFVLDRAGRARQVTHSNDWLKDVTLAPVREIAFRSKDGTDVHGFLLRPPGSAASRLPTILRIHGGPQSQYELAFNFEWQVIAAHGYAVVAANPRGSTGRGQAYSAAIYADWGGPDVEDELAAVDYAVKTGVADPKRLGVGGWSYGGMLTNYVIASDTRFKAATSGASIADILGGYGNDEYAYDYETELGTPWKNTATWMKVSYPFLHADRIRTPTLFLGGTADMNVPLHNGEQMYQALKSLGIDTELVVYPGQFHGLTKPSYVKDRLQRYLAWYDRHLLGKRVK